MNIKKIRKENSWTQTELANMLGLHYTTVWRWEHGKEKLPKMAKLAIKYLTDE